ncbi:MAG: helix-turn-helix domain-containing protein [Patescibacteria group bacterium]
MYKDLFIQCGLNSNEAVVYEYLIKNGESPASDIIKKTPLKRGVVYNTLSDLAKKGLINETKKKKIAYFSPEHPEKLIDYLNSQGGNIQKAQKNLGANIPDITSQFRLVSGKPGVKFFEGIAGIKKVLEDSLTSKTPIDTYADVEAIVKYIDKINREYVRQRDKLGIKKRAIILDSAFSRNYLKDYHRETTDMRFISRNLYPFNSIMQIYDNKISYITLSDKSMIGVIIEDKNIYQMHKSIFQYTWDNAKSFRQLAHFSRAQ